MSRDIFNTYTKIVQVLGLGQLPTIVQVLGISLGMKPIFFIGANICQNMKIKFHKIL